MSVSVGVDESVKDLVREERCFVSFVAFVSWLPVFPFRSKIRRAGAYRTLGRIHESFSSRLRKAHSVS